MARFFIDRPVFAWVIAIIIMLAGVISVMTLPVSQYPPIAPPTIGIRASYPGASAQTLQDTVTQVIEQKMNGIDYLLYMSSASDSSGQAEITLTFSADADPDIAQVQVQNKLQLAMPLLPQEVQRQGISVAKRSTNFLKVYAFVSEDGSMDDADIADYVAANLQDQIGRIPGIGEVSLFGSQYSMRIWLDPNKLQNYKLMPSDVINAIKAQNAQVSAGPIGAAPSIPGQQLNLSISVQERLQTTTEFESVILRTNSDGSTIRVRDVARVEMGSESYDTFARYNGKAATGIAVKLGIGANALDVANATSSYLKEMEKFFPQGLKVVEPFDTTPFVKISIHEVVKTLFEAVVLVFLVMYLFLQNFRATLIPTIAVPVVLLGTFGVLAAFGYSINTLTLFAVVLAIGLLVDDAIVVVENVERVMSEDKLAPKEATRKSMDQITGALVGIAMVLSAVFVPMAFFGGSVGVIYRQFSVTIVSAMILSVVVAIVLTPALCATILKPMGSDHVHSQQGFFGWFNRKFDSATLGYQSKVSGLLRRTGRCMIVYVLLVGALVFMYKALPTSFLPDEDQGILFTQVQLPTGATQAETVKVLEQIEHYFLVEEKAAVESMMGVVGFSFAGRGQNAAMAFVRLRDWNLREDKELKVPAVAARAMRKFSQIRNAQVFAFAPPAIMELGNATGFDFQLQDKAGLGHGALIQARNQLLGMAAQNKSVVAVRPNGQEDQPQLRIDIDREKAGALDLSLGDINTALGTVWGSAYADDFLDKGRVKKVYVQGDAPFRMVPEDMEKWFFRNTKGEMVPFASFASAHWSYAPARLERYNGVPSVEILGMPAPGKSSGEAMLEMETMAGKLPQGIGYEWTGMSYQERLSGSQAPALFALSILVVFLCLAALYESWSVPFAVVLVVPLGVLGALLAANLRMLSNDVYFQVGLLATIGLSAKNAILIVEFAKDLHDSGVELVEATIEASRMRLRPILMTSLAFLLGILPLAISTGAGAGGQNAIGTGVMGGTFVATTLGIFYIPVFFVVVTRIFSVQWRKKRKSRRKHTEPVVTSEVRP
ncbi:MAG: efflux RND transporter permease subunit [Bilophila sp.]